jgi:hypothetical protein
VRLALAEQVEVLRLYDDPSAVYNKTIQELAPMFQVCIRPSSLYSTVDDNI